MDLHSVDVFAARGYPWAEWDLLRREAPLHWYERPGIDPFWCVTLHEDVHAISADNESFITGGPVLRLATIEKETRAREVRARRDARLGWDPNEPLDLIFMDDPQHSEFRRLLARQFTPARCREMGDSLDAQAQRFVEEFRVALATAEPVDLVEGFSVKLPLGTICELMGLPVDDWSSIHRWTDSKFDTDSTEWSLPGETRADMRRRLRTEFFNYFDDLIARRHVVPGHDFASTLVHASVDGKPLTQQQLHGYFSLLFGAGNETSRNATTGGVVALLQHPAELARLKANPELLESAVEEILRWVSPVLHFARTATRDVTIRGQTIRKGDTVALWYPSANRDENVFDDPYRFDIARSPNPHLTFGFGAHFCLGTSLARHELRAIFGELLRTGLLDTIEIASEPTWLADVHVGAVTHQLVRRRA
jgi:cholest-4-en-3-one 26-monooxygenase